MTISRLLSLDLRLGRGRYLAVGTGLFAVKFGLDSLIARRFGKVFLLHYYISPSEAPLFDPMENLGYWLTMWCAALPFLFIGFVLTVQRLRDAGLSPWLALLFFAPFANIMFFAFCALVPSKEAGIEARGASAAGPPRLPYGLGAAAAALVGAAVGLVMLFAAVYVVRDYGAALFLGAPVVGGFIAGFLFARWHRPAVSGAMLSAMLAILVAGFVVVAVALEGLICLAMALPLVAAGSLTGAAMGCLMQRTMPGGGMAPTATALLLFPLTLAVERTSPRPPPAPAPVESSIVVDAPMGTVWRRVIEFPPLAPPTEWIFRTGIAAPVGAVIEGEGPGAIRRCLFTTGAFVEPVEVWDPPKELRFSVQSSPDPMREWTLWKGPRPPHLDGFLQSTQGQFLLEPLPGARTRLVGRTWYRTGMVPEDYWRLWADPIIHAIHLRVLLHVAALSEGDFRASDGRRTARP